MWKNVIELENKIKAERIELAKTYAVNNGINTKQMTEDDLLAIYSCLVIKAKKINKNIIEKQKKKIKKDDDKLINKKYNKEKLRKGTDEVSKVKNYEEN